MNFLVYEYFSGQKGVKSVIDDLGGFNDFSRVLIGIGRPTTTDSAVVARYVLSKFKRDELNRLQAEVFPKIYSQLNSLP